MNGIDTTGLLLLIPLLLIELALIVISLVDLSKRKQVKGGSKVVWVLVIILLNLIGPILYLVWGRNAEDKENHNASGDKD